MLTALAIFTLGCANQPPSPALATTFLRMAAVQDTVRLAEVASLPWDRACIIGPHTPSWTARTLLGFAVPSDASTLFEDDVNVIVFAEAGRMVTYTRVRRVIDIFDAAGKCVTRDRAILVRVPNPRDAAIRRFTFVDAAR